MSQGFNRYELIMPSAQAPQSPGAGKSFNRNAVKPGQTLMDPKPISVPVAALAVAPGAAPMQPDLSAVTRLICSDFR